MNHAQQRALERYGLTVTEQDLDNLVMAIRAGEGIRVPDVRVSTTGGEVWRVKCLGKLVFVVFLPKPGCVATFLPPLDFDGKPRALMSREFPAFGAARKLQGRRA